MKPLNIEAEDEVTPTVRLDDAKNVFEISGWSHPEDANSFFTPIHEWLNSYAKQPNEKTDFHFKLQYYNTASAKQLFRILAALEEISQGGKKVIVHWHYDEEDLDMLASGERYAEMLTIPFEYVAGVN